MGFEFWGLGLWVWELGCRVGGLRFTDAMDTREVPSERACLGLRVEGLGFRVWGLGSRVEACATPATYASRFAVVNSVRIMASVAVKVTVDVQSEHASQGPPSAPWNPAEQ